MEIDINICYVIGTYVLALFYFKCMYIFLDVEVFANDFI